MFKNIDTKHLDLLFDREPEARLVVETMLQNHKRILSTISHEIRNPLTLLYGNMQLLEKSNPHLKDERLWQSAKAEFSFTHSLLDDLSHFNNADHLVMTECKTTDFLRSTALSFAASLDDSARFRANIPNLPNIIIDETKIKRVLINLLKNAKEAISDNGEIFMVAEQSDNQLVVQITDTGCGISQDKLETIFEPFITYKPNGTGLGLAISKEIIVAHEGSIELNSTLGASTTFCIRLPF